MLTRTESRFGSRQPLRLPLHELPFQSGLLFGFFFFSTQEGSGGESLSLLVFFLNLPRCDPRPATGLPRAGARLSAVGALCPREPGSGGLEGPFARSST